MSNDLHKANKALQSLFAKQYSFSKSVELLSRNRDPSMTKNLHDKKFDQKPSEAAFSTVFSPVRRRFTLAVPKGGRLLIY